jgi:hypothetical protein
VSRTIASDEAEINCDSIGHEAKRVQLGLSHIGDWDDIAYVAEYFSQVTRRQRLCRCQETDDTSSVEGHNFCPCLPILNSNSISRRSLRLEYRRGGKTWHKAMLIQLSEARLSYIVK